VPVPWWYIHGITIGDIVFLFWLAISSILVPAFWNDLRRAVARYWIFVGAVFAMIAALLLSLWVNSGAYDVSLFYIAAIGRSGYFLIVSLVIFVLAQRYGSTPLICAYLIGLAAVQIINFSIGLLPPSYAIACTVPVLFNSNVAGNMLGVGIAFSTLLIIERRATAFALATILLFVGMSIFAFSKGTWLMVAFGLAGLTAAVTYALTSPRMPTSSRALRRNVGVALVASIVLAGLSVGEAYCHFDWKARAEVANTSTETRIGMVRDSLSVVLPNDGDGPEDVGIVSRMLLGIGVGRFADVAPQYDDKSGQGFSGHSSRGNPHSAFLFVFVSGGVAALALFSLALTYPFYEAHRTFPPSITLTVCLLALGATFAVSGAFQLQLFSQHYFWIFAGLLMAISKREGQEIGALLVGDVQVRRAA
jgi:hypothetical protein